MGLVGQVGLAVLLAGVQSHPARQIYERAIDESQRLQVTVTDTDRSPGVCCVTVARVLLVDAREADHPVEIATISETYETAFAVQRADDRSLVLSRSSPDYGMDQGRIKLFFDAGTKRLLKRVDFDTSHALEFADDGAASRALGVPAGDVGRLRERNVFAAEAAEPPSLPAAFDFHSLPQSTYREFARARPGRVRDGYDAKGTKIEESIGAFQREGDRFWFARTFYDGEGTTGVGAIGYLETVKYTLLRIPELFDWSVSGLLVEPAAIWAGRVSHPEGADRSGGLLRYDRRNRRVTIHDIPDAIHSIARAGETLFLGTSHGLYALKGDKRTRYRAEPDITGRFIVVSQAVP